MTCIVGIKSNGVVYIGGDSAVTHGTVPKLLAAGKVFRVGEFVMGGAGMARASELIRHTFKPPRVAPRYEKAENLDAYMNGPFVSALRKLLSDNGCVSRDEEAKSVEDSGGTYLVGIRGHLYLVDSSFAAWRCADDFNATGSGHEVALGALHALRITAVTLAPVERLRIALDAAERWQDGVRAPFTFEATKRKGR